MSPDYLCSHIAHKSLTQMHWQHPPLCANPGFLEFSHLFPTHALGEEALAPTVGRVGHLFFLPPAAPCWHSTPGLGSAWTLPGAIMIQRDVGTMSHAGCYLPPPRGGRSTRGHQRDMTWSSTPSFRTPSLWCQGSRSLSWRENQRDILS